MSDAQITIDPNVHHGQACIRRTRISVSQIVRMIANGDSIETLLEEFPNLTTADIYAALEYAARLAEEQITPLADVG